MRIAHVISSIDPRTGGPAVAIKGFVSAQKLCGLDVSIVSTYHASDSAAAAEPLRAQGIDVTLIGPSIGKLHRHPDIVPKLKEKLATADVVHIHALWEEIQHQGARVCRAIGKPYIIRPCGMLDPWSLAQGALKKKIYMIWRLRKNLNYAEAMHFTAELERDLTAALKLKARSIVEPNGVDLAEFDNPPPKGTFRNQYPQLAGRLMVLFMSRIHPKKGLDLLVPAFAKAERRNAMLVIAGPDDAGYRATVEGMARDAGISNEILFTGMLKGEARIAALQDADLFALPSYQENFGIAVVEALAAGCPTIISDQVNIYREVASAEVGAVVPTQIDPLAQQLTRWIADESLRGQAAAKAKEFARSRYDWKQIALRWKSHYAAIAR